MADENNFPEIDLQALLVEVQVDIEAGRVTYTPPPPVRPSRRTHGDICNPLIGPNACPRCHGTGYLHQFAHNGGRCYPCDGTGVRGAGSDGPRWKDE